ncbi:MAG: FAD-dependent monooxygenase [Gemmatimonadetes bacterium]|nr:FAD-dependent monooxygenase [Gemmatimonadota bacterium]
MRGSDAEVIVVGAGPAGAAAAAFLARAGVDVLLLDRAHFPRNKPCAEYLSPEAAQPLDDLGVLSRVEAAGGARLTGMSVTTADGTEFRGDFLAAHGFRGFRAAGMALRRIVLDEILLDHARQLGARVALGGAVRDLVRDDGRVVGVELHGGTVHRAPLVLGADGIRSIVARRLGVSRTGRWPRRYALVAHHRHVEGMGTRGEMHVTARGYVGLADVGQGVTNVAVVVPAAHMKDASGDPATFMDHWLAQVPHVAPRLAGSVRVAPPVVTGPFNHTVTRAWAPGAALVGDAADFFDPFTGEGIFAALRGAQRLLPYAFEACRAPSTTRQVHALEAWERARRDTFAGKWRVERLVGSAVAMPRVLNFLGRRLRARRDLADLLVGVAGDFVPPSRVLHPSFVLSLLAGRTGVTPPACPAPERIS